MPRRTLNFSDYNATGTVSPWGVSNSTPAFPSGYTLGSNPPRIDDTKRLILFSGSGNTCVMDNTILTGNEIAGEFGVGLVNTEARGGFFCDASGNGCQILINNSNIRLFNMTAFVLGTQVGSAITFVTTTDHICRLVYNRSGNTITVFTGANLGSLVSRGSFSYTNANTDWRFGVFSRGSGSGSGVSSLVSDYTASQTVTSINGGSPITQGASSVPAITTGFTGLPITITTDQTGLTCSGISGTTNAPTFDLSGWTEGGQYPELPVTANFTFTNGGEVSAGSQTVEATGYTKVSFTGANTTDNTFIGYWLAQAGHVVEGLNFYYEVYDDVVVGTNSGVTVTNAGTLHAWVRPASGGTSGRMYEWFFTIAEGGEVIEATSSNITLQAGRVEAREQMAVVRVKLAYQANSVAATVADLRTDFNSLISKMNARGWFTGGEVQTTMLKVAMQNGLIQFLNRIKKQAPDQMAVQSASVAADVNALRTDFNALLTKLKAANLMASS